MAGTHYGALNFTLEEEKKPQGALKKSGAIAAVVVAVCVMFFAGRVHKSVTTPFTHDEVMNVASTCPKNFFIGDCKECKKCQPYEYKNGGCTWFKDTFCSYCDPIPHCTRTNQACANSRGEKSTNVCKECDCIKAPDAYGQKTLEDIEYYRRSWDAEKKAKYAKKENQFSCFFNGNGKAGVGQPWSPKVINSNAEVPPTECRACTVCPTNYYNPVGGECNPKKHTDTVCKKCRVCKDFQYTSKACTYKTNTECKKCANCATKSALDNTFLWQSAPCSAKTDNKNVYKVGNPGTCTACTQDGQESTGTPRWFISNSCKPGVYKERCEQDTHDNKEVCGPIYQGEAKDTTFHKCDGCKPGFFIKTQCDNGISGRRGEKADCKATFGADRDNCGAYRIGKNDQCQACKVNRGCDKATGGEDCKAGQFVDKTGTETKQFRNFRTLRCENEYAKGSHDATYGECSKCEAWQFSERQCAAECPVFLQAGTCKGPSYRNGANPTACTNDAKCTQGGKKGFCAGQCNLNAVKNGEVKRGSSEDGAMEVNRKGIQTACTACPDSFVAGKDLNDKDKLAPSSGLASLCPAKYKTCAYLPQGARFDSNGMQRPPAYTTCDGKCPFSAENHTPQEQAYFKAQKKNFENCCKEGALGPACEWRRFNKQCRTPFMEGGVRKGMPYRKRTAKTGSYSGFRPKGLTKTGRRKPKIPASDGSQVFVRWCKQLCDDFPSCSMFEVARCLVDGTCEVKDSSLCDLYKGDNSAEHIMQKDKPAALKEETLKEIKKVPNDWTCAQGFAVRHKHQGYTAEWASAGFDCTGKDMYGVKANTKCGTEMCIGAAATCCEQNKNVCYTKPQATISLQQSRR